MSKLTSRPVVAMEIKSASLRDDRSQVADVTIPAIRDHVATVRQETKVRENPNGNSCRPIGLDDWPWSSP